MSSRMPVLRRALRPVVVATAALAALTASTLAYADGVDVSHWQGSVTWSKVKSDGVTFAFMKATEGTYYTDSKLKANWDGAQKQGIYRGAYHFARPSVGSAAAQARYFVSKVGSFKHKGDLPPVLDLEATGNLGAASLRTWVATWLKTTEQLTGRTPIIYVSPYFWIDHLGNSTAFHRYPLWVAHYGVSTPKIPGGWPTWTFWQRTSSGSVSGIAGHVDMNRFNGSSAGLAKMANARGGSSAPPPSGPTLPVGAATSVTMSPATTSPAIDQRVRFTGSLSTANPVAPIAGRTVALWSRPVGSGTWKAEVKMKTDSSGRYSVRSLVRASTDYQVHWIGGKHYSASLSPVVRLRTPAPTLPAVDLHKNRATVRPGAALRLYGHVTASGAGLGGARVSYYKRFPHGRVWTLVGRSTSTGSAGAHALVIHPKVTRVWKVVTTRTDGYRAATSGYLTVHPH